MSRYTHADEILYNLWLGNKCAALDPEFIKNHQINVVFNCSNTIPFIDVHLKNIKKKLIKQEYRLPVSDNSQPSQINKMYDILPKAVQCLDNELSAGNRILVHCYAGIQRSLTLVTAYILYKTVDSWTEEFNQILNSSNNNELNLERLFQMKIRQIVGLIQTKRPIVGKPDINFETALINYMGNLIMDD